MCVARILVLIVDLSGNLSLLQYSCLAVLPGYVLDSGLATRLEAEAAHAMLFGPRAMQPEALQTFGPGARQQNMSRQLLL